MAQPEDMLLVPSRLTNNKILVNALRRIKFPIDLRPFRCIYGAAESSISSRQPITGVLKPDETTAMVHFSAPLLLGCVLCRIFLPEDD